MKIFNWPTKYQPEIDVRNKLVAQTPVISAMIEARDAAEASGPEIDVDKVLARAAEIRNAAPTATPPLIHRRTMAQRPAPAPAKPSAPFKMPAAAAVAAEIVKLQAVRMSGYSNNELRKLADLRFSTPAQVASAKIELTKRGFTFHENGAVSESIRGGRAVRLAAKK